MERRVESCSRASRRAVVFGIMALAGVVGCEGDKDKSPRPEELAAASPSTAIASTQEQQCGPIAEVISAEAATSSHSSRYFLKGPENCGFVALYDTTTLQTEKRITSTEAVEVACMDEKPPSLRVTTSDNHAGNINLLDGAQVQVLGNPSIDHCPIYHIV